MDNYSVCHRFYYDTNEGQFDRNSMNVSYSGNKFYSYYTLIGLKTVTKTGENVALISYQNFSSTTSKHIGDLIGACPYSWKRIPLGYGQHFSYESDIKIIEFSLQKSIKNLEFYSTQKLTQKANRTELEYYYTTIQYLIDNFKISKELLKESKKVLKKYSKLNELINNDIKLKELRAKQRELELAKQRKAKRELNKLTKNKNISELAKEAYSYDSKLDSELKEKLKHILNPENDYQLAYIWFDSDFVKTSKHITVNRKEVEVLLKLYEHNKLKHGMTISNYTILSVKPDFITVGCHKIPVENIQALLSEMKQKEVLAV